MPVDTGHGAAITFGTSAYVFPWKSIDPGSKSMDPVEDWALASAKKTFRAGDLPDEGEIKVPFQWDDEQAEPALSTVAESITITYQSGATLAGTGLITNVKRPNAETGVLKMGELTIRWDAKTGPVFTPATP